MVTTRVQRLLFSLFLASTVVNSVKFADGPAGIRLQLAHGHDSAPPVSPFHRLRHLLRRDAARLRAISAKARVRNGNGKQIQEEMSTAHYHPACGSGEMRMHSGAEYGAGQYFVHFRVGSPAQRLELILDTGSDLTWVRCKYRCRGDSCGRNSSTRGRVFVADKSSSFRTLPCSSTACKVDLSNLFSLSRCPSPTDPCAYDYRYSDGSTAAGIFANEKVTFRLPNRRKTHLDNVLVGCSESIHGQSFESASGVMGLAYSNQSLAVKAAKKFGGKFSYCLVDHLSPRNVSSYLIFGSNNRSTRMHYTELVLGVMSPFYAVNLRGISIGGSMLNISAETWNVSSVGGVIIDSGSSLTSLAQVAYQPVMAALRASLQNLSEVNEDMGPLEHCFNSTGFKDSQVPRLAFHFTDGARLKPPVKRYVIDVAAGVKCLGFTAAPWPGPSVIGNIMQQNHVWEFDMGKGRLGFAASSCSG